MARALFSLYKRKCGQRTTPRYYVRFWSEDTNSYDTAISIESMIQSMNLPMGSYKPHRKADSTKVVLEYLRRNLHEQKRQKNKLKAAKYLLDFWDWDLSTYIKGKLVRNPDSIGLQYTMANKSWIKRYVVPRLGEKELAVIRTADIESIFLDLASTKQLAPRTLNLILQAVSIPFTEAVRTGLIDKDPTCAINKFGVPKVEKGILTEAEVSQLLGLQWPSDLYFYGFLVALFGGLRIGEILALRKSCIQKDYLLVRNSFSKVVGLKSTKTNRERKIPLPDFVLDGLHKLARDNPHNEDWIFYQTRKAGRPMPDKSMEEGFYHALAAIGIPDDRSVPPAPGSRKDRNLTFHSLRHWCNATLRGALPDEKLRLLTGHASVEMSNHYDHTTETDLLTIKKAQEQRILSLHPNKTLRVRHLAQQKGLPELEKLQPDLLPSSDHNDLSWQHPDGR